jgi:hypothetical protein
VLSTAGLNIAADQITAKKWTSPGKVGTLAAWIKRLLHRHVLSTAAATAAKEERTNE